MAHKLLASCLSLTVLLSAQEGARFDHLVRNDFFAGFGGDSMALNRALAKTDAVLFENPKHPEALVWFGAGVFFQSGQAFRGGNQQKGMDLFTKGTGMMDEAVALAPDNVGVRVPRGAVLLQGTVGMPEPIAKPLIEKGLADYLRTYEIQKGSFDKLGEHPRGELLFGIADAYRRLGNDTKAGEFFELITKAMPNTNYAKRADVWLTTKTLSVTQTRCVGCHVSASK